MQVSRGLWKKYGDKRIIDTPISEVRYKQPAQQMFSTNLSIPTGGVGLILATFCFWCRWGLLVLQWELLW